MQSIRNIAVGLPVRAEHVLMLDGEDSVKGEAFHRAIGGGIEFGETAEAALRREFMEELGIVLGPVTLLGVVENIFEHEGRPGHEIAHVFAVDSPQIDAIPLDAELRILDEGSAVRWVSIAATDRPLYPSGVSDLVGALIAPTAHPEHVRSNLLARRRIIEAYLAVSEQAPKLLEVCASARGDDDDLRRAVAAAFGIHGEEVDAVLSMQIRRFTPFHGARLRGELAETDRALDELGG
jgi:8-oxo-dGTP pyrophosphatase MutT (NUDIX family)